MSEKYVQKYLSVAVIAVVVFLAFGGSFSNGFHWDDVHAIIKNPAVRSLKAAFSSFIDPSAFSAYRFPMIRPVTVLSYAANYKLSYFDPTGWHFLNILVHFAACIAFFGIVIRLLGRAGLDDRQQLFGGLAASLVFAAHPIQSEALNYFSARSAILAGAFCLGALFFHLRYDSEGRKRWLAVAAILFLFGLFSRENATVFPAIVAAMVILFPAGDKKARLKSLLKTWPYWALLGLYMIYRYLLLGTFTADKAVREPMEQFGTALWVTGLYHKLLLFPKGLAIEHPYPEAVHNSVLFWVGVCVLVVELVIFGLCVYKKKPFPAFCLALFYLSLLPSLTIRSLHYPAAEHRTYLAMAGPGILVGLASALVSFRWPRAVVATLLALTLALAIYTRTDSRRWRTEVTLWTSAAKVNPSSPLPWTQLGKALKDEGKLKEAISAYRKSLEIKPTGAAYNNLSIACGLIGNKQCRINSLKSAIMLNPDNAFAHMNLGINLMKENNVAGAEKHLRKAVEILPTFPEAHRNLAVVLLSKEPPEKSEALRHIILSLEQDPYQERAAELRSAIRRLRRELSQKPGGGGGKDDE